MRQYPLAGGRRPPGVYSDLHDIKLAIVLGLVSVAILGLALALT